MRATIVPFRKQLFLELILKTELGSADPTSTGIHGHTFTPLLRSVYDSIHERARTLPIALARQWSIEGDFDQPTIVVTISRFVASLRYLIQYVFDSDML